MLELECNLLLQTDGCYVTVKDQMSGLIRFEFYAVHAVKLEKKEIPHVKKDQ